jgi:protein-S-isoprenylcysteine O-methyltransferase Ste14
MTTPAPAQDQHKDHPGVVIFPPVLLLATIALGIILDRFFPLGILAKLPTTARLLAGLILLVAGASLPIMTRRSFGRAGTNIRPDMPTTALVTSGIFSHVRNPAYQGGTIALLGLAFLLGADWIVLLMVPALLLLHYGVVLREEQYLEKKFGESYRSYKASVPRYGWKL